MKHIAAYLLAQLATETPSKDDVKKILASVGSEAVDSQLEKLFTEIEGKNVSDLITEGLGKLASVPSGGAVAAAPAAAAAAGSAAPAKEEKKKEEVKEESDEDMGFGLFD